jgi:7-cyano-7-deazaguanine synthase
MSKIKKVIIYSGGLDSYTMLMDLLYKNKSISAISFDYGQRHDKELEFAKRVCSKHDIEHIVVDINSINKLMQGSSLTSDIDIPEGHYEDENMKSTVVPNRNMIFISLATAYAVSIGANEVWTGVHAGDHAIYPDCRGEFIDKINEVTKISNYESVEVKAPFIEMSKIGIVDIGKRLGIDYSDAWTCYKGNEFACGKCGSCQERLEAFDQNDIKDPMRYET